MLALKAAGLSYYRLLLAFALPNLQSRIPLHVGPGFVLGQAAGVEAVTLTTNQIPSHTHPVGATVTATTGSPSNGLYGGGQSTGNFFRVGPPTAQANAGVGAQTGGNQPHDNMMPFLVVSFIISLFGIFPTQN